MKRSEAVQKLIDAVYMASESDLTMTEEEASNLLTEIENRIGMLPPTLTGTTNVEVDEETGQMFVKLWSWEDEDEKK